MVAKKRVRSVRAVGAGRCSEGRWGCGVALP